ncbi:hypothetical protein D3C80_1769510 [compost metagenome]
MAAASATNTACLSRRLWTVIRWNCLTIGCRMIMCGKCAGKTNRWKSGSGDILKPVKRMVNWHLTTRITKQYARSLTIFQLLVPTASM